MGQPMHDWLFEKLSVSWKEGTARVELNSFGTLKVVRATGLSNLHLPRQLPWGPSVHVNECQGPTKLPSGGYGLSIELQSGDTLELVAEHFEMPSA